MVSVELCLIQTIVKVGRTCKYDNSVIDILLLLIKSLQPEMLTV